MLDLPPVCDVAIVGRRSRPRSHNFHAPPESITFGVLLEGARLGAIWSAAAPAATSRHHVSGAILGRPRSGIRRICVASAAETVAFFRGLVPSTKNRRQAVPGFQPCRDVLDAAARARIARRRLATSHQSRPSGDRATPDREARRAASSSVVLATAAGRCRRQRWRGSRLRGRAGHHRAHVPGARPFVLSGRCMHGDLSACRTPARGVDRRCSRDPADRLAPVDACRRQRAVASMPPGTGCAHVSRDGPPR